MKQKFKLSNKQIKLLLAFLIPFLGYTLVMVFSQYAPFGKNAILYSDMYHQYYPFFLEFRDTLRSGDSLFYNWDMGMGVDYLGLIAYYLASPLNLLSVIVPEGMLLGFFSMLVPVKLGFAGLFFGIFLEKLMPREDWSMPVFASGYALCSWALGYQWNIMWLDTFALLPLVVLGTVSLLKERKFVLYTLSLFFSIACNYYIGFFVCIFVALCFFIYEICYVKSWKRFLTDLGFMFVFSFLAIAMTAFLELPALANLSNTYSSVNKFPTKFDLNITSSDTFKGLLEAMRKVAGNTVSGTAITYKEGLPNVYCGLLPLMLAIQFMLDGKFKLRERLSGLFLLIFFMLSFILRQLDYIWHGFHFTNMIPYRFSFLFSFVVLVLAYRALPELPRCPRWRTLTSLGISILLCVCSEDRKEIVFLLYNLVYLAIFAWLLLSVRLPKKKEERTKKGAILKDVPLTEEDHGRNRQTASLLLCAMLLELACSMVNFATTFSGPNVSNYPKGTDGSKTAVEHMKELEKDTLYYRAEATRTQSLNDGALNGFSGVSLFSSSTNVQVTKMMTAIGYAAKPSYNRYAYEEASPVSNLFLNLKYLLSRENGYQETEIFTPVYSMGQADLLRNEAYLPLGFMTTKDMAGVSSEDDYAGTYTYQNLIFSKATGLKENVYKVHRSYTAKGDEGITVTERSSAGAYSYNNTASTEGYVTVSFTVPSDGFVCLDFYVTKRNSVKVYRNDAWLFTESLNLDQMIAVGDCKAGDVIDVKFKCKANESGKVTSTAALLNHEVFWQGHKILKNRAMELTYLEGTRAEGVVTATAEAPVLYTSVPYNENWTVTVDGKPVEKLAIFDAMVGVQLEPGDHTVRFSYKNTAFYQGLAISLTAAAMFVLIVVLDRRLRKKAE